MHLSQCVWYDVLGAMPFLLNAWHVERRVRMWCLPLVVCAGAYPTLDAFLRDLHGTTHLIRSARAAAATTRGYDRARLQPPRSRARDPANPSPAQPAQPHASSSGRAAPGKAKPGHGRASAQQLVLQMQRRRVEYEADDVAVFEACMWACAVASQWEDRVEGWAAQLASQLELHTPASARLLAGALAEQREAQARAEAAARAAQLSARAARRVQHQWQQAPQPQQGHTSGSGNGSGVATADAEAGQAAGRGPTGDPAAHASAAGADLAGGSVVQAPVQQAVFGLAPVGGGPDVEALLPAALKAFTATLWHLPQAGDAGRADAAAAAAMPLPGALAQRIAHSCMGMASRGSGAGEAISSVGPGAARADAIASGPTLSPYQHLVTILRRGAAAVAGWQSVSMQGHAVALPAGVAAAEEHAVQLARQAAGQLRELLPAGLR